MQLARRLKVLLVYPVGDPFGAEVHAIISESHDVVWSGSDRLPSPLRAGIEHGARQADLCVAVLSRAGVVGRSQTYFATGIALGVHTPTLVVGAQQSAPRFLQDLPFVSIATLRDFPDSLRDVRLPRSSSEIVPDVFVSESPVDNSFVEREYPGGSQNLSSLQLEHEVARLFRSLKVMVREQEGLAPRNIGARPDLVVWEDTLLQEFGLPLPVEVKTHINNPSGQTGQYRSILKASGAQTLLVVSGDPVAPWSWTDGLVLALIVSLDDLREACERRGLADAMRELLARSNNDKR
jgi:hypothetical protein